ncbi:MAG: hypothetical protein E6K96_04690 [Thaumarchaeota archaeon]|nr:MAG: hypothetical protein E6K96_04690 [Nitrososphaerota archaeon]
MARSPSGLSYNLTGSASMTGNSSRFARLVSIRVRPGKETDFAKTFEEKILPSALREAGLRRLYLLRSLGSPAEFVTFSLWDSEKKAEEYVNSGRYKSYVSKFSQILEDEPTISRFVVDVHAVGQSVKPPSNKRR